MNKEIYTLSEHTSIAIPNSDILATPLRGVFTSVCNNAFKAIEKNYFEKGLTSEKMLNLVVTEILVSKEIFPYIRSLGMDFFDEATQKQRDEENIYGDLWNAKIKIVEGLEYVIFIGKKTSDYKVEIEQK